MAKRKSNAGLYALIGLGFYFYMKGRPAGMSTFGGISAFSSGGSPTPYGSYGTDLYGSGPPPMPPGTNLYGTGTYGPPGLPSPYGPYATGYYGTRSTPYTSNAYGTVQQRIADREHALALMRVAAAAPAYYG